MNITKEQADKVIAALEVGRIWAECEKQDRSAKFCNEAITIIRGLAEDAEPETAMVDAAMVAMKGIYPPLRRSECQKLIRAAFNATSPQAAQTEADELLAKWGLDQELYRTDGGALNHMKIRAALKHPDKYPYIEPTEAQEREARP